MKEVRWRDTTFSEKRTMSDDDSSVLGIYGHTLLDYQAEKEKHGAVFEKMERKIGIKTKEEVGISSTCFVD
jgi:hypothetical protein